MLKQHGYSLISLMISLTLGSVLLGAAFYWAQITLKRHQLVLQTMAMEDEMSRVLQLMRLQLRRAGYDGLAVERLLAGEDRTDSPFFPALQVSSHAGETDHSCVVFRYDKNHNGRLDSAQPVETLGFRLHNQAIEYRVGGRSCQASGWHDLTSSSVLMINHLAFEVARLPAKNNSAMIRITFEAALSQDPDIARQVVSTLWVRNF
ncbi:prepilin-type N-terminal cleavage/methylation domain-containing protein [Salinimonas marina]|uniref:Prepilin-type N-terminal cleavage/methylation domain-containing protein n=1 Tax=Salinimonas marina TaxID=2785918 RepID=A0A7S9DYV9_9ALTE|nr:prepilin-type N-terminal cleavage/methylation domain-containing protein [Salinimonas marina]QPG06504.1 prepilin-type N-terminal cleavage/methylation domain-containing protein [Salinimonas marina]